MRVHFVGIGGYGMSAIAHVLHGRGDVVTGSDVRPSSRTARLEDQGIRVSYGHRESNQVGADRVVYSTDVPADNVELNAARLRGAPVLHRSELLAEILEQGRGICVTGTHGKTTTTTMIAAILIDGGLDPGVVVGGEVDWMGGNARIGQGEFIVAEADESDGSFLRYHPEIAVLTNAEPEHLDHYQGDFANVVDAYRRFLSGATGLVLTCKDAPLLGEIARSARVRAITYGLSQGSDIRALRVRARQGGGHRFTVRAHGVDLGRMDLHVPGLHNVRNALAAVGVGLELGVPFETIAASLKRFRNAARRFEETGYGGGIRVVSDYAHHPTEISAVIEAASELRPQRLIAVFQPQRFQRTKLLFDQFAAAFLGADVTLLLDIYSPPGEEPISGIDSGRLAGAMRAAGSTEVHHVPGLEDAAEWLRGEIQPGDLVLVMGAGDIYRLAAELGGEVSRTGLAPAGGAG